METAIIVAITVAATLVITLILMLVSARFGAKRQEAARAIAAELGLTYRDRRDDRRDLNAMTPGASPEKPRGFIGDMFDDLSHWRLEGERNGIAVSVHEEERRSGKSSVTYIVAAAQYPAPLPYKLKAAKEGVFTKIGKGLFGLKDVEIGVPEFDDAVRIKTDDDAAARNLFSNPSTYEAFLGLVRRFPRTVADSNAVVCARPNAKPVLEEIRELVGLLSTFAANVR